MVFATRDISSNNWNANMVLSGKGNVGIGTYSPEAKLDVNGEIQINGGADSFFGFGRASFLKPIDIRANSHCPYVFNWYEGLTFSTHSDYEGIRFYNQGYPDMYGAEVLVMSITNNNVGIGTTNPTNKLYVNGTIHSKEVKVDMNGWSDFVFKKEYNLPTLDEVEKQINEKGNLANIPNEDEVLRSGINLGEMNTKLLQKVEELILYVIGQNKCLTKVERENKDLKKYLKSIKKYNMKFKILLVT